MAKNLSSPIHRCLASFITATSIALGLACSAVAQKPMPMPAAPQGTPQLNLPRASLSMNMFRIDAQLARSPAEREIGLMFRESMPEHEGMLFIFEQPNVQCFWMRNTLLPLTAAFIADDGTIVNLADMQPMDETSHCSAKPVRYVLEMNQGWFAKRNIAAGMQLRGDIFQQRKQP